MVGRMLGREMCQMVCQREAPSSLAASNYWRSMEERAARKTTLSQPKFCQISEAT